MRLQRVLPAALALAVIAGFASAAGSSVASSDSGFLQQFAPRSATTWWAIVAGNLHAKTWVVRTTDSGRHWHAVTPPVKLVSSSSFLGSKVAWIEAGALHPPRTELVYRTLDGGRSWRRLARVPAECRLDFVDLRHGWCIGIDAAMGSAGVHLYRTGNGGASWSLVSRTGLYDHDSTRGALPYGCDKTIAFTSPRVGWAALFCNAGLPTLYRSSDSGARWHELAKAPMPKGAPSSATGGGVSLPAVQGSRLAVSLQLDGTPRVATVIATSANSGRSWRSLLVPGRREYWGVDLVDVRHWRLSDGATLLTTGDAGRHWHRQKDPATLGSPVAPDFLSPRLGFALPDADGNGGLWWTRDGGKTWRRIEIKAGPFTLPSR